MRRFSILFVLILIILSSCEDKKVPKNTETSIAEKKPNESEMIDLSKKWVSIIESTSGFNDYDKSVFVDYDFSKALSNQPRFDKDPISTYVGIFGPKFRRIDFHLKATKNGQNYSVTGKSKLGENIRELKGEFKLKKVLLRKQDYITDSLFIGLFDCKLEEPGDRDGDGVFNGVFALVFYVNNDEIQLFKTDSGDDPTFTNTFVGKWQRNNSQVERQVIFSFHAAGLYEKLPFCENLYDFEFADKSNIKTKYLQYGWDGYDQMRGKKTTWWKK